MDIANMFSNVWIEIDGTNFLVADISSIVNVPMKIMEQRSLFLTYSVVDGETPRDVAKKAYGDKSLYWTIMFANNLSNSVEDWPVSTDTVIQRLINSMGSEEAIYEIEAYVDAAGNIVDIRGLRHLYGLDDTIHDSEIIAMYDISGVTFEQMAILKNEAKRNIRLIDPDYILEFQEAVRTALA